jgi:hypothetical protein
MLAVAVDQALHLLGRQPQPRGSLHGFQIAIDDVLNHFQSVNLVP